MSNSFQTILQVHKFFYPHAGTETSLFNTRALLADRGHRVVDFAMEDSRNVRSETEQFFAPGRYYGADSGRGFKQRAGDALASIYSVSARNQMNNLLVQEDPDIAHLHLISHQLTFSVVDSLYRRCVPTVMTLHDYKIACPAYVMYRDGVRCTDCAGGNYASLVRHRCIKGSTGGSVIAAVEAGLSRIRSSWHKIDVFIAPSKFAAEVALSVGIEANKVRVLQNFIPDAEVLPCPLSAPDSPRFFIATRLEAVKGLVELLTVFGRSSGELGTLVIAGAGGELEPDVIRAAEESRWIEYLGRVSRAEVAAQMRASTAALVPSLWDENNPFSLLEARAAGVPVIATSVGGLPEMVTDGIDGFLVEPSDTRALTAALFRLANDFELARGMAEAGRRRLARDNSEASHYSSLMSVYAQARSFRDRRQGRL